MKDPIDKFIPHPSDEVKTKFRRRVAEAMRKADAVVVLVGTEKEDGDLSVQVFSSGNSATCAELMVSAGADVAPQLVREANKSLN